MASDNEMKTFEEWLLDITKYKIDKPLPDGIWEKDGKYMCSCCRCERVEEIPCDISEIPEEEYRHYCGGSQRCCP